MGVVVLLLIVVVVFNLLSNSGDSSPPSPPPARRDPPPPPRTNDSTGGNRQKTSYRPSPNPSSNPSIKFGGQKSGDGDAVKDLKGLHDAYSGAELNPKLGLYQCRKCKVFYHRASYDVLRDENQSKCVACQAAEVVAVDLRGSPTSGRDYTPDIVTLNNYRQYVNSVVTFEGTVVRVQASQMGDTFAVMFENRRWVDGFKLVFFRGAVQKFGGGRYIESLSGRRIRVRGLIINHENYGYEIIVSEKTMILSVH